MKIDIVNSPERATPHETVLAQVEYANARFGPLTSSHEGYGVLAEEVAELLDAIRANDREAVEKEACQVSAVALRLAECCRRADFARRSGFAPVWDEEAEGA